MCWRHWMSSTMTGEQLFIDIRVTSAWGKRYLLLVVNDCMDYAQSYFLKEKSELVITVNEMIEELKAKHGIKVQKKWCDNVGENKALEALCKQESPDVIFEYTAPSAPQKNDRVEQEFATLLGRVCLILNHGNFSALWRCFFGCSKCFLSFFGKEKQKWYFLHYRNFVKKSLWQSRKNWKQSLKIMLLLAFGLVMLTQCCEHWLVLNPKMRKVMLTRDVIFMKK